MPTVWIGDNRSGGREEGAGTWGGVVSEVCTAWGRSELSFAGCVEF